MLDPKALRTSDLVRLLNSTPLGPVASERLLRNFRLEAGYRIGDGKTIDLLRFVAWLMDRRDAPPEPRQPSRARSINASQAELMQRRREAERDLRIPPIANPARRRRCEKDVSVWLGTYAPRTYTKKWTKSRKAIAMAILELAEHGGDRAFAAPRGRGKSKIAEGVVAYCLATGRLRFPLICTATTRDSQRILRNVKMLFERNDVLAEDYPEICTPIRALRGAPQKGNAQTVGGERTFLHWGKSQIVFPTVAGSRASGAVFETRSFETAIRGVNYEELRPDLVIIDDPETRESIRSEDITAFREGIIEQDLAGLGVGDKPVARLMLTTIQSAKSLSAKYTDPQQKPSWSGMRFRLVESWPAHEELWDEYTRLLIEDQQTGDRYGRRAHAYYLARRKKMDAGVVVEDPDDYNHSLLPDGSRVEVSAIQHAYNLIARLGRDHFNTEYQNDPPEEELPVGSGLTSAIVQSRLNGYAQGFVPEGTIAITAGCDVGKYRLHWVVVAWMADGTGRVIDYGVHDTGALQPDEEAALDRIIRSALLDWRDQLLASPYARPGGEIFPISRCLVDGRFRSDAVHEFVRDTGASLFLPHFGIGDMAEGRRSPFRRPNAPGEKTERRPGDHYYWQFDAHYQVWQVFGDTDHWKSWLHDRWLTPVDRPGALSLWGDAPRMHLSFAKHQVAEQEEEVWDARRGLVRKWVRKHKNNHWFDALYMAAVAGSMCGVQLFATPKTHVDRPRMPAGRVHRIVGPGGRPFVAAH